MYSPWLVAIFLLYLLKSFLLADQKISSINLNVIIFYLYSRNIKLLVIFLTILIFKYNTKSLFTPWKLASIKKSKYLLCFIWCFRKIFIPINCSFKTRFWLFKQFYIILSWLSYDWNIKFCISYFKFWFWFAAVPATKIHFLNHFHRQN